MYWLFYLFTLPTIIFFDLLNQIQTNPRIRRTYSSKHVYFWSKSIQSVLPVEILFQKVFPTIWSIQPKKIVNYVLTLLSFLKDNFEHLALFKLYRPSVMSPVKKENLFTKQTHEYEPKTLVVLNNPLQETIQLTTSLFENCTKMSNIVQQTNKSKENMSATRAYYCLNKAVRWRNKEINSFDDLKGLKMRIPGFGGKVLSKAGGTAVTVAGGEIYTNLERGVIDATEWIGPYHDYLMGFYQVAKYYYYPGWHEPGGVLEMIVNKDKFSELPSDLQEIIKKGIESLNIWMQCEFDSKNSIYLNKLLNEENVQLRQFPKDVLDTFKSKTEEVIQEMIETDSKSKKIFEAYDKFRVSFKDWSTVSDRIYYEL